jgi:hypothetical protein
MVEEPAIISDGQVIKTRNQDAVAPCRRAISPISSKAVAIGNRCPVDDFRIERRRGVSADIVQALRPNVTDLQVQSTSQAPIELGLQALIVNVSGVIGRENPAPIRVRLRIRIVAALIDSLQTSQDFLRSGSLSCVCRGDDCVHSIDSIEKSELNRMLCLPFR